MCSCCPREQVEQAASGQQQAVRETGKLADVTVGKKGKKGHKQQTVLLTTTQRRY
jgi:hypothetical protein